VCRQTPTTRQDLLICPCRDAWTWSRISPGIRNRQRRPYKRRKLFLSRMVHSKIHVPAQVHALNVQILAGPVAPTAVSCQAKLCPVGARSTRRRRVERPRHSTSDCRTFDQDSWGDDFKKNGTMHSTGDPRAAGRGQVGASATKVTKAPPPR